MPTDDPAPGALRDLLRRRFAERGLYLVTDDRLAPDQLETALDAALRAGAPIVQFRMKRGSKRERLALGQRVADRVRRAGALVLVNDELDLALALDADGLHLGQDDLPPAVARRLLGPERLIGVSVSHLHEVAPAEQAGADYLGVGAIYPTGTKPDAEPASLALLAAVRAATRLPIVAIGGITAANLAPVIQAGADAVAVVSAVFGAPDPGRATTELLAAIAAARLNRPTGDW